MSYLNKALSARNLARKKLGQNTPNNSGNPLEISESSETQLVLASKSSQIWSCASEDTESGHIILQEKTVSDNKTPAAEPSQQIDGKCKLQAKAAASLSRTPPRRTISRRVQLKNDVLGRSKSEPSTDSTQQKAARLSEKEDKDKFDYKKEDLEDTENVPRPPLPRIAARAYRRRSSREIVVPDELQGINDDQSTVSTDEGAETPSRRVHSRNEALSKLKVDPMTILHKASPSSRSNKVAEKTYRIHKEDDVEEYEKVQTPLPRIVGRPSSTYSLSRRRSSRESFMSDEYPGGSDDQSTLSMDESTIAPPVMDFSRKHNQLAGLSEHTNAHKQHINALQNQLDKANDYASMQDEKANEEIQRLQSLNNDLRIKLNQIEKDQAYRETQDQGDLLHFQERERRIRRASEEEIAELRSKIREQNNIISELEDRTTRQTQKLLSLQNKLENSSGGKNLALQEEIEQLRRQLKDLDEEKHNKDSKLQELAQAVEKSETEMLRMTKEMEALKEKYAEKESRIKQTVEAQLSMLQKEVAKVAEKSGADKKRKEETIAVLKKTLADQQKKLGNLEVVATKATRESEASKQAYNEILSKFEAIEAEKNQYKYKLEELEVMIDQNTELLHQTYAEQIQKLQEAFDREIEAARREGEKTFENAQAKWLEDLESRLEQTTEECMEQLTIVERERDKLKTRLESLDTKEDEKDTNISFLEERLKDVTAKNESLQKQMAKKDAEIEQLREDLKATSVNADEMNDHFDRLRKRLEEEEARRKDAERYSQESKSTIESMENRLKTKQLSLQSFEESLDTKHRTVNNLENEVNFLRKKLQEVTKATEEMEIKNKGSLSVNDRTSEMEEEIKRLRASLLEHQEHVSILKRSTEHGRSNSTGSLDASLLSRPAAGNDFESRLAKEVIRRSVGSSSISGSTLSTETESLKSTTSDNKTVIEHMLRTLGIDEIVDCMNNTPKTDVVPARIFPADPSNKNPGEIKTGPPSHLEVLPPATPSQEVANRLRAALLQYEDTEKTLASLRSQTISEKVARDDDTQVDDDSRDDSPDTYFQQEVGGNPLRDDDSTTFYLKGANSEETNDMGMRDIAIRDSSALYDEGKTNISTPSSATSSAGDSATLDLASGASMDSSGSRLTQHSEAKYFTF